jgi:hypothetical protein
VVDCRSAAEREEATGEHEKSAGAHSFTAGVFINRR